MNCRTPLVSNSFSNTPISTFAYTYDALSRRTQRLDTTDSALTTNTFSYNVRSELIDATMGTNTYSYAYDPIGNRQMASANEVTNLYQANELNQYTNINNGVTNVPTCDADGNMLTYNGWTLTWNAENRLVGVTDGITTMTNSYDYMGRRVKKVLNGEARVFLYDGWAMIREETELVKNSYVYGIDLSGSFQGAGAIGAIVAANLNGTNAYYSYDANGNVVDLVDSNGNIIAHYEYSPFGQTTAMTGELSDDNPYRFSTKFLDDEYNLYYYGYRYMEPKQGFWLNRDPIGEQGGPNLYSFIANNPVCMVDKDGAVILVYNWGDDDSPAGIPWEYAPIAHRAETRFKGSVSCECITCSPDDPCEKIQCEISLAISIQINERFRGDVESTKQRYGHEQRHVQNFRGYVRHSETASKLKISDNGCYKHSPCQDSAEFLARFYSALLNKEIEMWEEWGNDGGGDHWKPPREPSDAQGYPPIGQMPPPTE